MSLPDPDQVRAVYDRTAARFGQRRSGSVMEQGWIDRFVADLPKDAHVLDLGCGTGEPVARTLLERGCRVTGADISGEMLALAKASFPQADWVRADIQRLDLGQRFEGIVAWHSIFHLTIDAQREALPRIIKHLTPGGLLLMTTGLEEGESHGHVEEEVVYHASLDRAEYDAIFRAEGCEVMEFVADDQSCGGANVWLVRTSP
ncbi:class I SAM-dependent methyltransferase [Pseudooceanicola sp. MF1-13]|uniref:class I SAM-dependent methyltransferase n=1 Tax=Pseudooceanicola sp. MF1-13 TaxID=3379095 RepID=UPI0038926E3A